MTRTGEALKRWRTERDLSQEDAARQLSPPATQGAWAAWETGRKPPSLTNAVGIERLTGGLIRSEDWVDDARESA